ncbi:sensor histidine kinase [Myxococcus stipitatus]|uniref:sensor histidine kinase n=1 Tax=Myxococcus stipitatus TaxID=83455 RepID=UPI0022783D26|nr:ATP-binding protein [Myxococcus stipitatus]
MSNNHGVDALDVRAASGHAGGCEPFVRVMDAGRPEASLPRIERDARARALLEGYLDAIRRRADALSIWLMGAQWLVALVLATVAAPAAWAGREQSLWWGCLGAGVPLVVAPSLLVWRRPGAVATRHVVALTQVLWSVVFIVLSGGRVEAHFHMFGALALLSFYRDPGVLLTAGGAALLVHGARAAGWPEALSISGGAGWRVMELALWLGVVDVVLVVACRGVSREMWRVAEQQVSLERACERERLDRERAMERSLRELRDTRELAARMEKLAAVGQRTATVSHELRNPLAAARTANAAVARRLRGAEAGGDDARLQRFLDIVERELAVCSNITSELLEFVRERPLVLGPCALRVLVDEVFDLVPGRQGVRVENRVPVGLETPWVDRELLRRMLINLVQNAVESMPAEREGVVEVSAEEGGGRAFHIRVSDNGSGIPDRVLERIFEPLFTTKEHGTGLGLAVVSSTVRQHGGTLRVESSEGKGSVFTISLPRLDASRDVSCNP